jgi:murein DD-endopeptidase MepM/ murein hydrolase activator NlpD
MGDPAAVHSPERSYRAPFAVARMHRVSQAYPDTITHTTLDAAYAVDIAMPIGTDVYAARAGVVIDAASTNYRGGLDPTQEGAAANVIRILHDDGTYAIYAHLNWNTIRVRPGDVVERGEYIADSGNTGFSTGPHLHFAVIRNADMRLVSVPVTFEGPNGIRIVPEVGTDLTAY